MKKQKNAPQILPREEWPYEVPENWVWTHCGFLTDICTGKKDANYGSQSGKYLFFTCAATPIRCENYSFDCKAIILAGNGDLNNISIYDGKFEAYQRTYVIQTSYELNLNYLYYVFKFSWVDYNNDKIFGSTIPYIRLGNLKQYPVPLPPLPEQQRIVDRIESLFAKLDAAAEKIRAALDASPTRKAALLHKAFTGELTKKWREENDVGMESWEETTLGSCGEWSGGGTPSMKHPEYWENANIRWVTAKDMKIDTILDTQMHINSAGEENSSAKLIQGTALLFVTRSGILRRTFPVAMINGKFTVNQDLKVLKPNKEFDIKYLLRACQTREQRILNECMKSGTTVESINFSALKKFLIPVCSISEQKEIVRILDAIFEREQAAKETAERLLEQIALTKKSILARAFRGLLGTNDPKEESAEGWLEEKNSQNET